MDKNGSTINGSLEIIESFSTNSFNEKYLYSVNRDVFNRVGSQAFFNAHFTEEDFPRKNTFYLVVGTDSGLLINYIIDQGIPEGTFFLFVELPEVLSLIEKHVTWDKSNPAIVCTTYDDWLEKAKKGKFYDYIYLNSIKQIKSVGALDAYLPQYLDLFEKIRQDVDFHYWGARGSLGNELFIYRQMENITENLHSTSCLKDIFKGQTAVLLAGGPSVDKAIPWVKKNRDKIVLLAVSRVSKQLIDHDLYPDIIFSVDPTHWSFDICKEMTLFWDKVPLFINQHHAHSELVGQWRGNSLFLGDRFPWKTKSNVETLLYTGPSVTNTALSVSLGMGMKRIILTGVDLCFSKEGYTHAIGTDEYLVGPNLGQVFVQIETNGGWLADTRSDLVGAAKVLEWQAEVAEKEGCTFINPAPEAAKIPRIEHIPFEDLELEPLAKPASETILEVIPRSTRQDRLKYYGVVEKELQTAHGKLLNIKKLAIEALRCNDGLFGRKGMRADFKYKKKMDKIEKTLNRKYESFSHLVKLLGLRTFLQLVRVKEEWTDEEIETTGRLYYEAYRDTANSLLDLVGAARLRLAAREEEEKENPQFDLLIEQWQKDNEPGRGLLWQQRNPEKYAALSQEVVAKLKQQEEAFYNIIKNTDTEYMRKCKKSANLANVKFKAKLLFHQDELKGLEHIARGLEKYQAEGVEPLRRLVNGYVARLTGDTDLALSEFTRLVESENEAYTEEALQMISSIALKQQDVGAALVVFEQLSAINPVHMRHYAELLKIAGQAQKALNCYADYLEKFPDDLTVMLKVGLYYNELNLEEGARMMFNHVLAKDADNMAARKFLAQMDQGPSQP